MGSQCSKIETSTSATASTDMGESSSRANRKVSACVESFRNETMKSIEEMKRKDRQRCYESDVSPKIWRDEIESFLRPVLQDGYCSIKEDRPNSKTKISKWKLIIKARLKEQFQGNGKGLVTKFFPVLRKLRKKYKMMAKKVIKYAKDGIENTDWKLVTRLIFLTAVIAVLICAVTAPQGLPLATPALGFFRVFQDWYENQFKEAERKNHGKKNGSSALIKLDEKKGFAVEAKAVFQKITEAMKKFAGAFSDLLRLIANSFKSMLEGGRKVIENVKKEVKNKAN